MDPESGATLSRELMGTQLSTIELLGGMFPGSDELSISPATSRWIDILIKWCSEADIDEIPIGLPSDLPMALNLTIGEESPVGARQILLNIFVPTKYADVEKQDSAPVRYFFRQPSWLSKAQLLDFSSFVPQDDIFEALEWFREEAPNRLITKQAFANAVAETSDEVLVRVWFYFPSLSTREKRDDMVNFAPAYQLTGFVLAGKPGVLCLEGTTAHIDAYMKFIKTHSWGDIPSYQKKVSERFRETQSAEGDFLGIRRVFGGMEEITGNLGDRGGARANRGDMQALEIWLKEKGLGDAFEKVIF